MGVCMDWRTLHGSLRYVGCAADVPRLGLPKSLSTVLGKFPPSLKEDSNAKQAGKILAARAMELASDIAKHRGLTIVGELGDTGPSDELIRSILECSSELELQEGEMARQCRLALLYAVHIIREVYPAPRSPGRLDPNPPGECGLYYMAALLAVMLRAYSQIEGQQSARDAANSVAKSLNSALPADKQSEGE